MPEFNPCLDLRRTARLVGKTADQPSPEQLRRRSEAAERDPLRSWPRCPSATAPGFQLNGLKREELIATNSMLLHELYFGCLGGDGKTMEPAMALALAANFGSVERWREEFVAMGKAQGGGSGWVLLTFQPREGSLVNQWAADHTHALAGGVPILALDMYEHSYHMDFGAAAGAYVDAFMDNIDWAQVYQALPDVRFTTRASHSVRREDDGRRTPYCSTCVAPACSEQAKTMIPGARWRDPAICRRLVQRTARRPRGRSSIVFTATRSDVPQRCACAPRVCKRTLPARRHRRLAGRRPSAQSQVSRIMNWVTRERRRWCWTLS